MGVCDDLSILLFRITLCTQNMLMLTCVSE